MLIRKIAKILIKTILNKSIFAIYEVISNMGVIGIIIGKILLSVFLFAIVMFILNRVIYNAVYSAIRDYIKDNRDIKN